MQQERVKVMNKNTQKSDIQTTVMNQINSGKINMKPRIYFTILWLLGIFASIGAGLSFAYAINMINYVVRIQTSTTPAYGARQNLDNAIANYPWWILVISVVLIVVAIWLMRKNSRIYRYKLSLVIVVFLFVSTLIGVGMSYLNIGHNTKNHNKRLKNNSQKNTYNTQKNLYTINYDNNLK